MTEQSQCGCRVEMERDGANAPAYPVIYHCPLHAKAGELLAALEAAPNPGDGERIYADWYTMERRTAIASVRGEE